MKYIPLVVTAELIPALLDDSKTMTRRLVYGRTPEALALLINIGAGCDIEQSTEEFTRLYCPYRVGDGLWVKEEHFAYGYWQDVEGTFTRTGRQKRKFYIANDGFHGCIFERPETLESNSSDMLGWYKRLARFMPKKFCRLFLEILEVRLEPLKAITEQDAKAEGMRPNLTHIAAARPEESAVAYTVRFIETFQRLHGPGIWNQNPFVWVVRFKRIDKPQNWPL
jgi:hypothetical protein